MFFNNYQVYAQHANMCPANHPFPYHHPNPAQLAPPMPNYHQSANLSKSKKCHSKCDCSGKGTGQKKNSSDPNKNSRKRSKPVEKENIDPETFAKLRALEWENTVGYWCTKCNIRFPSSDTLVDHMAKNLHKNPASKEDATNKQ